MYLQMVGIEHERAGLSCREAFAFHRHEAKEAMEQVVEEYGVEGCVLLSTCNRTELYLSSEEEIEHPFQILCDLKQLSVEEYKNAAVERTKEEVVEHLFLMACGMKSKIFGEDQIITQVKDALSLARDAKTSDVVLEKLFQIAITAAKKVKTQVHLTAVQTSVIQNMMNILKQKFDTLEGVKCLVIGNGNIGQLAVEKLLKENADVTMTLRQYKSSQVQVKPGCKTIDYQERYNVLKEFPIVISGTSSPHHTIKFEDAKEALADKRSHIFMDLAVPRDFSSCFEQVQQIELYNIDSLGGAAKEEINNESVKDALLIMEQYEEEFYTWDAFRSFIPLIQSSGRTAGVKTFSKIEKKMKKIVTDEQLKALEPLIRSAAEKVVTSTMYGMREHLPKDAWKDVYESMERAMVEVF